MPTPPLSSAPNFLQDTSVPDTSVVPAEPSLPAAPGREVEWFPTTEPNNLWHSAPAMPLGQRLNGLVQADCLVVGAGFSGLACARRLAELRPQWSIVVVDALAVGDSSSGRNSGFVMDVGHWHDNWPLKKNRAVADLSTYGLRQLRERVIEDEIECDWFDKGRYHAAINARGRRALASFRDGMRGLGRPYEDLPADELAKRLGTDVYTDGLHVTGGALVNPAQLVRGLAAALPENVTLLERSCIKKLERGPVVRAYAANGRIESPRLILANNGFLGAMGVQRGRILPFATFASATAPLDEAPGADAQWGLVPEEQMGSTVRLTADRRILIRGGVRFRRPPTYSAEVLRSMAAKHRESFERRFPQLRDVPFTHSWGGVLGVTINTGTMFGELGDNAWVCGAHNGVGMAMGTAMGDLLAHKIAGDTNPCGDALAQLPKPGWMPPEPLLGVGISGYLKVLEWLAGDEV